MIKIFTLKNKFQKESVNLKKLHLHQENQETVKENRYHKADIDTFNFLIEDHNATLKKTTVMFSVRALIHFLFNNLLGEASIFTKTRDKLF